LITPILSWGRDRAWKEKMVSYLPAFHSGTFFDLACGTGDITFALAGKYPQGTVIGVDLTLEMLNVARDACTYSNVNLVIQDMGVIGIKDESVDIVTGGYALRNAPDLDQALSEIYRVLKRGGKALFLDFSKSPHSGRQQLSYLVLKAWGSLWGLIFHRSPDVYGYIAESLQTYPDRKALSDKVISHGFNDLHSKIFFLGLIEILHLRKAN